MTAEHGRVRHVLRRAVRTTAAATALAAGLAGCGPGAPPAARELELTGDLRTHDPALVAGDEGEPWYVFSTGDRSVADGAIQVRRSEDGRDWTYVGEVWDESTGPAPRRTTTAAHPGRVGGRRRAAGSVGRATRGAAGGRAPPA